MGSKAKCAADGHSTNTTNLILKLVLFDNPKPQPCPVVPEARNLEKEIGCECKKDEVGHEKSPVVTVAEVFERKVLSLSGIQVLKAYYCDPSDPSRGKDVTDIVKGMMQANALKVKATNCHFGDPARG